MFINNPKFILRLSNHALERARQRMKIDKIDKNSLEFEFKVLEIIKTRAVFFYEDKSKFVYKLVYNNETYKVLVALLRNNTLLVETIIKV